MFQLFFQHPLLVGPFCPHGFPPGMIVCLGRRGELGSGTGLAKVVTTNMRLPKRTLIEIYGYILYIIRQTSLVVRFFKTKSYYLSLMPGPTMSIYPRRPHALPTAPSRDCKNTAQKVGIVPPHGGTICQIVKYALSMRPLLLTPTHRVASRQAVELNSLPIFAGQQATGDATSDLGFD